MSQITETKRHAGKSQYLILVLKEKQALEKVISALIDSPEHRQ